MELYERQLNFLESILNFHPEFIEIFTPEEKQLFHTYFLPNWEQVADFKEYHQRITKIDPEIEKKATALLIKFLDAHEVHSTNLLPRQ